MIKRFACWKSEDVYRVVNPDADALEDHIFRAVHTDFPVQIRRRRANANEVLTAATFLDEVLDPKDHVIVPVVGQSGTGKSHLIRWLNLQLRGASELREVIYVQKAQTNLREIIHSLVRRLPAQEQAPYLKALNSTGSLTLSSDAQRTAILNQLHLALVNDAGGSDPAIDPELEQFALKGLRAMFMDPHIRKSLLADDSFAAQLAAHVFEKPDNYRPAEERREFRNKDLPLQVGQLKLAAHDTQEFLRWLMNASDGDRNSVIGIVNRHVDWAIGNCLNLSGDRLIELMLDLRRYLRRMGRELILLIEDFARLQGLDRALLQSIIEQRPDLCILRTVFASTVGFYESVEATIKTRITFIVDMDAQAAKEEAQLDRFVARYMTAVRWGSDALRVQWEEFQTGHVDFAVPSKCDDCPHRGACHSTFGAIEGMGLYPFTSHAVATMAARADTNYKNAFNPREFLKQVIRPVALAVDALENGLFPPPQLLANLGGRTMASAQQSRLKREDPQQWERRAAMLELWGGTLEVANLAPWLHAAFDLPPLAGTESVVKPELVSRVEPTEQSPAEPSDERLRELQEWQEGRATLAPRTAQALRDLVFRAINEFIDWDEVGLPRAPFFGAKGAFKPGQISFYKQATQASTTGIRIQIPLNWDDRAERLRTTMALEGLLEAKAKGDWSFLNGLEKLACLLELLRTWSKVILDQFRMHDTVAGGSDISTLAFEVRVTLQAALNPSLDLTNDQDVLKAAFMDLPASPPDFLSTELSELANKTRQVDGQLLEAVRTRLSATKGGDPGNFIDSAPLITVARSLRRRRFLPGERLGMSGGKRRDVGDPVTQSAVRMAEGLVTALQREASAREEIERRLRDAFGDRATGEAVKETVQRLIDAAGPLSIEGLQALVQLKPHLEQMPFDSVLASLRSADSEKLDVRQLRSGAGQAARILDEVMRTATRLLDRTEAEVAGRLKAAGVDPEEKARLVQGLKTDLEGIGAVLTEYQNGNPS